MASQYTDLYEEWKAQGRPGGSFEAWKAQQGGGPQPTPAAPTPTGGGLNIADFQQRAAQSGASEDWTRFQQGDLDRWSPFYDAASGRFRSSRGAEGLFDKPTECPPGMGPSGPNETDPCTTKGYEGTGGQVQQTFGTDSQGLDLQQLLASLMPAGPYNAPQAAVQPFGGAQLQQAMTPLQSSTQGLLQPQGALRMPNTQSQGLGGMMTGLNQPGQPQQVGGLTDMMRRRQKPMQAGSWF